MVKPLQDLVAIGLDLGGTNIKLAVLGAGEPPAILDTEVHPTPATKAPEAVVERLTEIASERIGIHGPSAIGIGVPGQFDLTTGTVRELPNLTRGWQGFGLHAALEANLGSPVVLINDAQASTLAEATLGAARGYSTVQGVALGTGIGGGLIVDGRLHRGAHGSAGEVGHQVIQADGPDVCSCGNRGCLESLAKAAVLAEHAGRSSAEAVFEAAEAGDERAMSAIETIADYLGVGLANVITIVDPDIIVIGGGLSAAGDLLLDPIRRAVARHLRVVPAEDVHIAQGTLGITAGAVGTALAAMETATAK